MTWMAMLFTLIGVVAGMTGSLVGMGGGIFFVPALLYFANRFAPGSMTPQIAAATSLAVIAITALSSTTAYLRQKRVDILTALLFFLGSAPGAIAGVYVNQLLQANSFYLLFGLFQLAMFGLMMVQERIRPRAIHWHIQRTFVEQDGTLHTYGYNRWLIIVIAFLVGVTASLFGVGGGVLMVPVMIILFRFPPHVATATSMMVIFLSAIVGSITNVLHGYVDWLYALFLAPGAWIGGKLGAMLAKRIKSRTLIIILRVLILLIGLQMIGKAILEYV